MRTMTRPLRAKLSRLRISNVIPDEGTDTGPGVLIKRPEGMWRKGSEIYTARLVPDPMTRFGATANREYSQ
jgi:hypothetical protein